MNTVCKEKPFRHTNASFEAFKRVKIQAEVSQAKKTSTCSKRFCRSDTCACAQIHTQQRLLAHSITSHPYKLFFIIC